MTVTDPAGDAPSDLVDDWDDLGPVMVPEVPDVPDGGGLIPDDLADGFPDTALDGSPTGVPGGSDPADAYAGDLPG
ncbi:hypothetical protein [Streptomyces longwoodensis]